MLAARLGVCRAPQVMKPVAVRILVTQLQTLALAQDEIPLTSVTRVKLTANASMLMVMGGRLRPGAYP